MGENEPSMRAVRHVTTRAWRTTFLVGVAAIVVGMFVGMAYLVYLGRMSDGPLLLYAGVILGYLLHAVRDVLDRAS